MSTFVIHDLPSELTEPLEATTEEEAVRQIAEWLRQDEPYIDWETVPLDQRVTLETALYRATGSPLDEEEDEIEHEGAAYRFVRNVMVELEQREPRCPASPDGEHDWRRPHELVGGLEQNPGVRGHGGGVQITSVCVLCGCGRHEDTWASDPRDGSQGHVVTRFVPGEFSDVMAAKGMWSPASYRASSAM